MRCIGSEGVDLSHLGHSPSYPDHGPGLHDVIMASTVLHDVTKASPPTSDTAFSDSRSYLSSHTSSSPASPQLSPVSTRSDSDLAQRDSRVLEDLTAKTVSPRSIYPQQLSSLSSPELNTLSETSSKRSSPGVGSTCSLCVSGDSGSEEERGSSRTSTAKNTLSSGSSLNTVADELSSGAAAAAAASSSAEILNNTETTSLGTGSRKLSEGCVQTDDAMTSESFRRHHLQDTEVTSHEGSPPVQLPERYRHVLRKSGSNGSVASSGRRRSSGVEEGGEGQDVTSREKDLGTALAWVRHEMVQMKEQDKVLLKRFIELRASILQLRCLYGSASSVCSMDGSSVSLNEARGKSTRMRNADSDAMLAEGVRAGPSSSLSLPCSPQLSRLRWRSDELM